jgi:CubicO group peptidase (beta-lactamase class C family)
MKEEYPDVHSLLSARNDSLVYEEYFYTFTSEFPHNIQSVTKSFVSALTGIALAKGEIKNVNDPLCSYLPEYQELLCSGQNKTITLHNVLSMSTGLKWDEATYDYGDPKNSLSMTGNDPFGYLFTLQRSSLPEFAYNSMNHSTMNAVLKNATHMNNATEITSRLLTPLGIRRYFLGEENHGVLGDIDLRPRDMMKLGQLYLQEGKWNGKEIVSKAWVNESTTTKIAVGSGLGYGYFWWTRDFKWKDKTVKSFFAWGYGGQYIFVLPELKLVVVMTGSHCLPAGGDNQS